MTRSTTLPAIGLNAGDRAPPTALPSATSVQSGDVRLAVYRWGARPESGAPTLVLVHGYPDSAAIWQPLAKRLGRRFQVIAYDVRGAGRSSAPTGREAYRLDVLSADLRAVIDAVSPRRPVHLVGYDWGALQCWEAVLSGALEGRVASYSAAAPSLDHVARWFATRVNQPTPRHLIQLLGRALGSSYMMALQLPRVPEWAWRFGLGRLWPRIVEALESVAPPPSATQTADGIHGLGLYRANLIPALRQRRTRTTDVRGQLLVMTRDPFVPPALFDGMETSSPNFVRVELDAGHWAVCSQPALVARTISDFVTRCEEA